MGIDGIHAAFLALGDNAFIALAFGLGAAAADLFARFPHRGLHRGSGVHEVTGKSLRAKNE